MTRIAAILQDSQNNWQSTTYVEKRPTVGKDATLNWEVLQRELAEATSFELEQIRTMVARMLDDPVRIARVRDCLRPGLMIRYWDDATRSEIFAEVLELKRSLVLVKNLSDGAIWNIPMTVVNAAEERALPQARLVPSQSQNWRVGDSVCFRDQQNREIFGQIIKLNPKRAKIRTSEAIWNVGYDFLTHVVDTEATSQPTPLRISAE